MIAGSFPSSGHVFFCGLSVLLLENDARNYAQQGCAMQNQGINLSEIYCAIHQLGNEFFFNRMSFKRKQASYQQDDEIGKMSFQN